MITIRSYEKKDREAVENICVVTAVPVLQKGPMKKALLDVWCNYYIEREPENVFVAANDEDETVGYILCAESFDRWKETFLKEYIPPFKNPVGYALGKGTVPEHEKYKDLYPAHMHIDILPEYQHQGIGPRLLEAERENLRNKGVKGLMLCCGADNEKGLGFYRKAGFTEVGPEGGCIVFALVP